MTPPSPSSVSVTSGSRWRASSERNFARWDLTFRLPRSMRTAGMSPPPPKRAPPLCPPPPGNLKRGAARGFESTVYPGATEEIRLPVIEKHSGMQWRRDFFVGYSPERINPGDPGHSLTRITKVVAGDTAETLERVAAVYGSIIKAGVHRASCIKVAEAAKVIENTQRDLNIALMNELSLIFHKIGIDTMEVLQAAGTKWNFLPFRPGLV